ncbi:MAG: hypothetical protein WAO52_06740 [Prolixibacteraceae bacterium]
MNKFKIITALFLSLLIVSCNKSEDEASGVGDVIIVTKKIGTNTVHGLSVYAYTFSSFKSVTVVGIANGTTNTISLKANQGYKTNFYYEAPDAEFSPELPLAATYNFSAVFENGATDEFQDILTEKFLPVPNFTKTAFNTTTGLLEIEWDLLADADSYSLHIWDGSTQVFGSTELANTVKSYAISANGGGWASGFTPQKGKTYTVKLFAYLYEPGGNTYNLQASAVAETTVGWGN